MQSLWGESDEEEDVILAHYNDAINADCNIQCDGFHDKDITSTHSDIKENTSSEPTDHQPTNASVNSEINAQNITADQMESCMGNENSTAENDKRSETLFDRETVHDINSTKPASGKNVQNETNKSNLLNEAKDATPTSHTENENISALGKENDARCNEAEEPWTAENVNQMSNLAGMKRFEDKEPLDTTSDGSEPLSKPLSEYRAQSKCKIRQSVKRKTDLNFEE